ncbi:MAG: hypothetical protein OES69_16215, partial [Myxococcales bacterium]|nr:hypothetical protein [Myxococcales bacterium]
SGGSSYREGNGRRTGQSIGDGPTHAQPELGAGRQTALQENGHTAAKKLKNDCSIQTLDR